MLVLVSLQLEDTAIRLAIGRTIALETPRGWRVVKEKQAHKINVVVALAMPRN
jgi:hypothetical protein